MDGVRRTFVPGVRDLGRHIVRPYGVLPGVLIDFCCSIAAKRRSQPGDSVTRRATGLVISVAIAMAMLAVVAPAADATAVSSKTLLGQLVVAAEHTSGYDRSLFPLWTDADHDGCNTRYEVLIAEAVVAPHVGSGCSLSSGRWFSRYDGVFTNDPSTFDIDHFVPLAEAWRSGAWRWNTATRTRYANDLGYGPDLVAVTAHSNRSKGDQEPQTWLPPRRSFDCTYLAWWVAVKWRWHLKIDGTEKTFLTDHLRACGWPTVRKPTRPSIGYRSSGGGGSSTGGARITAIYFDSPGSDTGSNSSLNAEWVRIKNATSTRKTLTGWTLHDSSTHVYVFPTFALGAGASVKVHTGSGANTAGNLYWHEGFYVWNNSGDTATLTNAAGTVVDRCGYTSSADPEAPC